MVVTWVTMNTTRTSQVEFGRNSKLRKIQSGNSQKFTDGGTEKRFMFIHRVTLKELTPGTKYCKHFNGNL
jgi:acid phosphatase type 7